MRPLELTLQRTEFGDTFTGGKFFVEGMFFGDSIEPKDRELYASMPLSEIRSKKVYGKTAIPYGRYKVIWAYSPRLHGRTYARPYGGKFPCLVSVPCWSGVLFHPFNYGTESQGCIAFGERWKAGKIINATKGYKDFMDFYFVPAMERGQDVYITITK